MTSPEEEIPDFLVERIRALDEEPLRHLVPYAREPVGTTHESIPENVATSLYLQDDEVMEAVADYAERLADAKAEGESLEEEDDGGDDEDDDGPSFMTGPAFG